VTPVPVGVDPPASSVSGRSGLSPHPINFVAVLVSLKYNVYLALSKAKNTSKFHVNFWVKQCL
jgi:hypothetical protein